MAKEIEVDVLIHQAKFIESEAKHTALIGGYGSGKTQGGILKVVSKKMNYPGVPVAYYMPTYGLIEDVAFERFEQIFNLFGISYNLNKAKYYYDTPYGRIIMRSLNNADRIVGYEVGYSLIDETDLLPTDSMTNAFKKIIARNRKQLPHGHTNQIDVVGTPEGFKFAYNFFVKEKKANRVIIKAKTADNPYLPEDYIETLSDSYTPEQLQAYLNGEFVNLTSGTVYYRFKRNKNHTSRTVQSNDVLHIGMDFNVTKMNAVVHVVDQINNIRVRSAVDEFVNAYDTAELIALIKQRYPNYKIIVYPDASGANRSAAGKSDIDLLKEAGFVVRKLKQNPFVKDRVNIMNVSFEDTKGISTYRVNTDTCPVYTEALENQTYKNGEPDKKSGFDHITEAGGYFVYYDTRFGVTTWGSSRTA